MSHECSQQGFPGSSAPQPGRRTYYTGPQPGQPTYNTAPQPGQPTYNTTPQPGQPTYYTTPQLGQPTYYTTPQPGQPTSNTAPQPGQPTYNTTPQPGQTTHNTTPQPGQPTASAPQEASKSNINQQNVNYFNYGTQSTYLAQPGQQNFQAFHIYPQGHYQHIGPGHPPQQAPPASGYSTQPPGAGSNPPPGGYSSPPQGAGFNPTPGGHFFPPQGSWHNPPPGGHFPPQQPAQHVGHVHQVPAQNLQAQMMMNNVYNTGCTINNVGSIGSQTTYNIIGSNVGHVGPKITKNITIKNLSLGMGVQEEELDTFTNLLGDDKNNDEYLETFTTLMHEHNFLLPSVSTMTRSTCLIQHTGPHGGKWHGTGFLSTLPNFEGAALLSAGHNFADEDNLSKDFESFHLLFNNELGLNASSLKTVKNNAVIDFNLTTFMSKFPYTTLIITYKGKQLIQYGSQPPIEKAHKNTKLDYFALILHGPQARQKINQMNLDFVEAADMKELQKSGEPVFIFGYPGMKFCVCCNRASGCSCGRQICVCRKNCNCGPSTPPCSCHPGRSPCQHKSCSCQHSLRFSYALSKSQKLKEKEHMKYLLDTLAGMSGAVITGAKYKVKGIHILGGPPGDYNRAQTLIAVMKDIHKLNILKNQAAEKCVGPLEKLTLNEDSNSSNDSSDPSSPIRLASQTIEPVEAAHQHNALPHSPQQHNPPPGQDQHQEIPSRDHPKKEEDCKVQ